MIGVTRPDLRCSAGANHGKLLRSVDDAGFYKEIPDSLLEDIRLSRWIVVRVETTALTPYATPFRLSKWSCIGVQSWPVYRAAHPRAKASTAPRLRVLTLMTNIVEVTSFDLDSFSEDRRRLLFDAVLSCPFLMGHEVGFDLHWLFRESNLRPKRLLDLQMLAPGLRPGLLSKLFMIQEDGLCRPEAEEAIRRCEKGEDWRGSAKLNLLAVAAATGSICEDFANAESWCVTVLSCAHRTFTSHAVTIIHETFARIFPACDQDDIGAFIDKAAPWYSSFGTALLRLSEASLLGLPFHLREAQHLEQQYCLERHCAEAELVSFPAFDNLAEEMEGSEIVTAGMRDSLVGYAEAHRLTFERTRNGDIRTGQEELILAGCGLAAWWNAWSARADALSSLAAIKRYKAYVTPGDRVHPLISMSSATGRVSAKAPSVQNIPSDPRFRALVKARPGHVILSLDFSAIELRIAAVLAIRAAKDISRLVAGRFRAGEEAIIRWLLPSLAFSDTPPSRLTFEEEGLPRTYDERTEAIKHSVRLAAYRVVSKSELVLADVFRSDLDPHLVTGLDLARRADKIQFDGSALQWLSTQSAAQRVLLRKTFAEERHAAKACNFGLLYGMGVQGLHQMGITKQGLTWSLSDATEARKAWFELYPDVRLWQLWTHHLRCFRADYDTYKQWDEQKQALADPRYGRVNIYNISTLTNRRFHIIGDRRAALNYQNQGTGADILALSIALLPEYLAKMLVLSVHDELVFEVPKEAVAEVEASARASMIQASNKILKDRVPMAVEACCASTWSDS